MSEYIIYKREKCVCEDGQQGFYCADLPKPDKPTIYLKCNRCKDGYIETAASFDGALIETLKRVRWTSKESTDGLLGRRFGEGLRIEPYRTEFLERDDADYKEDE
jgi:hypothetical protein